MEYSFQKAKIPRELSFPVKRSVLDEIIRNSETNRIRWVHFNLGTQKTDTIVWANFVGEAHKTPSLGNIGLYVYAVPANEKVEIERLLIEQGFPKFVEWLKQIEILGEGWRSKTRLFHIHYRDKSLSYSESE